MWSPRARATRRYRPSPRFVNADSLPPGWTMTSWGPLGPADRDVLIRVRTAGLWEGPVGQQAQKLAGSTRVKEVGQQLFADHTALDVQVRQVAAQLRVQLPDQPTREQQGWIDELAGKHGDDYDRTFADRLRAAHGKVFGIVAAVRSGTRNDLVRSFAQTGINVVMKHMTLLESTSLVNYDALPTPSEPPQATIAGSPLSDSRNAVIWIVLGLALLAGIPAAIRVIRLH
jgi:predicted outer membrane protein